MSSARHNLVHLLGLHAPGSCYVNPHAVVGRRVDYGRAASTYASSRLSAAFSRSGSRGLRKSERNRRLPRRWPAASRPVRSPASPFGAPLPLISIARFETARRGLIPKSDQARRREELDVRVIVRERH